MIIVSLLLFALFILSIHSILQNQRIRKLYNVIDDLKYQVTVIDGIMQDKKITDEEKVKQYFWNLNNLPF
jgi:hypothetical protein